MKKIITLIVLIVMFVASNAFALSENTQPVDTSENPTFSSVSSMPEDTSADNITPTPVVTPTPEVTPAPTVTRSSSGGGSRRVITQAPVGQVLGAETTNWNNLSASEKAVIIKGLQASLAEIIKTLQVMIANGTLK